MFPLALLNASSPPSPPVDPGLTLALLHFDGANNSTVFTDSSPFNQTVSLATGTPKISTAMSKFGGSSLYLDGSSSIKIPDNANLNLGTGVFTIEFWFYLTSLPSWEALFLQKFGSPRQQVSTYTSGELQIGFLYGTTTATTVITAGTWYHVAVVRETTDGAIKQYLNGVHEGSTVVSTGSVDNAGDLTIGNGVTGYIDEFRIRKEAVYTGNFTPPTAPFTYVDYNTVLWLKFEGANGSTIFTDSSSQNNTITRYGSPSISTTNSKFGNSCLGINATSYLKINRSESFDIGAGQPFTIQMWLKITGGTGAYGGLISMRDTGGYCPVEVNITNNGTLATKIGNATLTDWDSSSFTMSTYVWRHFAIVGDGSLIKVYNHGVQSAAFAQPHWPNDEYLLQINRNGDNQMQSCANIDHLSFHKTALWLSDFTPPTSEFTY